METVYHYCAVIGGILFAGQVVFSFFGGDDGLDVDADIETDGFGHSDSKFLGMLSLRAIVVSILVFGLAGLGAGRQFDPVTTFVIAVAVAAGSMYLVAWFMQSLHRLNSDGTARVERTVGKPASVYLTVPENNSGAGKVVVKVQGRTMEYQAMTAGESLPTGTPVVVVDVINANTVNVAKQVEAAAETPVT